MFNSSTMSLFHASSVFSLPPSVRLLQLRRHFLVLRFRCSCVQGSTGGNRLARDGANLEWFGQQRVSARISPFQDLPTSCVCLMWLQDPRCVPFLDRVQREEVVIMR